MTSTVFDLRYAWDLNLRPAAGAPASDEADEEPDGEDGPPDPSSEADAAGEEEEDNDDDDGDEEIKDPAAKARSDEAKKYRLRAKEERQRADQAEVDLRGARLELAFYRAALAHPLRITDLDAAYKLAELGAVSTDGDAAAGLAEAVEKVVQRYPHLTTEDLPPARHAGDEPLTPSGRIVNSPRKSEPTYDRAALSKKFPSLGRRVGR